MTACTVLSCVCCRACLAVPTWSSAATLRLSRGAGPGPGRSGPRRTMTSELAWYSACQPPVDAVGGRDPGQGVAGHDGVGAVRCAGRSGRSPRPASLSSLVLLGRLRAVAAIGAVGAAVVVLRGGRGRCHGDGACAGAAELPSRCCTDRCARALAAAGVGAGPRAPALAGQGLLGDRDLLLRVARSARDAYCCAAEGVPGRLRELQAAVVAVPGVDRPVAAALALRDGSPRWSPVRPRRVPARASAAAPATTPTVAPRSASTRTLEGSRWRPV